VIDKTIIHYSSIIRHQKNFFTGAQPRVVNIDSSHHPSPFSLISSTTSLVLSYFSSPPY